VQPLGCQAGSALTPRLSVRIQRRGCAPWPTAKSCCALDPPFGAAAAHAAWSRRLCRTGQSGASASWC